MPLTETAAVTSLEVEHLCDASIDFEPVQTFATPLGTRLVFVIRRGSVTVPGCAASFCPAEATGPSSARTESSASTSGRRSGPTTVSRCS